MIQDKTLQEKLQMLKERFENHSVNKKKVLDNPKEITTIKPNENLGVQKTDTN